MKIVLINGSPRKGNTYHAAKLFLDEMARLGEITCTEYLLPRDLPEFCLGCGNCFHKGEDKCPHAGYTIPIMNSMIEADALIFASPVFVWQTTGVMKTFLDHFGHMFLVHRPREEMFSKKAFILETSNGGLKNTAIRPIKTNLKLWGISRIFSEGFVLKQMVTHSWDAMPEKRKTKFEERIKRRAKKFYHIVNSKRHSTYIFTRIMFSVSRRMIKKFDGRTLDETYWADKGWIENSPF